MRGLNYIGFRDEKFFDETHYAELVAKKFNTQHTVFSLRNDDLDARIWGLTVFQHWWRKYIL